MIFLNILIYLLIIETIHTHNNCANKEQTEAIIPQTNKKAITVRNEFGETQFHAITPLPKIDTI